MCMNCDTSTLLRMRVRMKTEDMDLYLLCRFLCSHYGGIFFGELSLFVVAFVLCGTRDFEVLVMLNHKFTFPCCYIWFVILLTFVF